MSNKTNYNNVILYKLLSELLGNEVEYIVFDVNCDFTTLCFGVSNSTKLDKCYSVIKTLIAFGIVDVINHSFVDGVHLYNFVFLK